MGFRPILEVPGKRQPQSWEEYRREVERQARPRREAPPAVPLTDETRHPGGLTWPVPEEKQCRHIRKATGKRCGSYAMKGARFCNMHGGTRDNPAHPAAARLLRSGALDAYEAEESAWREIRRDPAREAARSQLVLHIKAPSAILQRDAMRALAMDDGGKAWRRLLAEVKEGRRT
jgi:hypothetical protein